MKLYFKPHTCALAVDIVAREAGISLERITVDLRAKKLADGGDYYAVNPKGQVPALRMDDGQVLTETTAIMQYLADSKPEAGLLPPAPSMDRYRVLEWLSFVSTELHKSFGPLFQPTTPAEYRTITIENLRRRLALLDKALDGREFLHNNFSIADAYCYTIVVWSRVHKIDLQGWPHLTAYINRIEQRPSVQAALA